MFYALSQNLFLSTKNRKQTLTRKKKVENQTLIKIVNKKVEEGIPSKDTHQTHLQKKVQVINRLG